MRTIEQKREFAKNHLRTMVRAARADAAHSLAQAKRLTALASFYDHRLDVLDAADDTTVELMIADWLADLAIVRARGERNTAHNAMWRHIEEWAHELDQYSISSTERVFVATVRQTAKSASSDAPSEDPQGSQ